ncbi:hypothetical protein [Saccharomonospora piscinae]|uniref:hypothetical protein n=1 Tax=Saccharomonospora piscinae TaxID=687388 RepID=UPI0004653768|nr:hypothetical protein [Saccharomonospora piscinae]
MTTALNTLVHGGPASCVAAAEALDAYAGWVQKSGDQSRYARGTAESGWEGPAHQAFDAEAHQPTRTADDLAFTCQEAMRALTEFAAALTGVQDTMADTLATATAGGLTVQEPFILPPQPPGPKPGIAPVGSAHATDRINDYQADLRAWQDEAKEYNRLATLFNQCADAVGDARQREYDAHETLRAELAPADGSKVDDYVIGTPLGMTVAGIVAVPQSIHSDRLDAFRNLGAAVLRESTLLNSLSTGQIASLSEAEKAQLIRRAEEAGDDVSKYRKLISDYDRYTAGLPHEVRAALAAHPQSAGLSDIAAKAGISEGALTKALKATPFVGSGLTAGIEAWNASQGGQSWPEAGVRTVGGIAGTTAGTLLGSTLGSAASGALFGSGAGPAGSVIGGVAGALVGGLKGAEVAQSVLPDEPDVPAQPRATIVDTSLPSGPAPTGAVPTPPPLPR